MAREELSRPDLNQGDAVVSGGVANSGGGVGYFYARCIVRSDGAVEVVAKRRSTLGARVVYSIHGLSERALRGRRLAIGRTCQRKGGQEGAWAVAFARSVRGNASHSHPERGRRSGSPQREPRRGRASLRQSAPLVLYVTFFE